MFIVDAHLDLSMNALSGRDILQPAAQQPKSANLIATVGLPDLKAGRVGLVCATVFTAPSLNDQPGYRTVEEAHAQGQQHLNYYRQHESQGHFRFVRWRDEIAGLTTEAPALNAILLMEGADPLRTPADAQPWFDAGLRIVGLAWKRTRMAGGTGDPGPLTAQGIELVRELDRLHIIHDASHLAEESFWQLLKISDGRIIASHSNCRSIVPSDRQLSDEMIAAIVSRSGVIGINFYDRFLLPPQEQGQRRAKLADVVKHIRCICDIAGNADHVAIGTDMDGGLGRDEIPEEITTSADLPRLADALTAGGFGPEETAKIMGGNWLRFFARHLPDSPGNV
jgi:membrane dipeptidase